MKIASVEVRRYRTIWGNPVRMTWDPTPRTLQDAAVVVITADDGTVGIGGGDDLPDGDLLARKLAGVDPRRTDLVHRICATVDFHRGRPWIAELACHDLAARAAGEPLWRRLGGRSEALLAYASTGEACDADERVERSAHMALAGFRAIKLRLPPAGDWRAAVAAVARVREAVGPDVELMVDANQGWRMAGDTTPTWDVPEAVRCARALEEIGVYWLEEPLPTSDVRGYAELRAKTTLRIAAGEMLRSEHEARDLLAHGGIDVLQCDVALAGGITGAGRLAGMADLLNRWWSPHTWTNGLGLVFNLHAALALSACPFVEVPFDPPGWSPDRRDWLLPAPIFPGEDGLVRPPDGPGCGVPTDLAWLEPNRLG
ncbi:MAG: mandelate racemase/muconate lactonizing enzyme family protein [Gaiellales bacterium]